MKFLYFSVTVSEFLCDFFWISCWNFQADQEECKHCNAWLLCVWDQKHKLIRISNPSIYKVEINWWNLRKGSYLTNYDLLNFCCFWISKKLYSQYLKQTRYWDKRSAPKLYSPIHISDVIDFHQKPFHAFWVHLTFTVMIIDIYKGTWEKTINISTPLSQARIQWKFQVLVIDKLQVVAREI